MSYKDTVRQVQNFIRNSIKIGASLTISLVIPVNAKIAAGISFSGFISVSQRSIFYSVMYYNRYFCNSAMTGITTSGFDIYYILDFFFFINYIKDSVLLSED
jgi:hypothetical protein